MDFTDIVALPVRFSIAVKVLSNIKLHQQVGFFVQVLLYMPCVCLML